VPRLSDKICDGGQVFKAARYSQASFDAHASIKVGPMA
jgi:hypothetical protein